MAGNSNSASDMLMGLLGDDAGEKIKALFGSGQNSSPDSPTETESMNAIQNMESNNAGGSNNADYINHIRGLVNELSRPNDPRAQLLLSLKPYMSDNRKRSIDNAVKLLNISKISGMFK